MSAVRRILGTSALAMCATPFWSAASSQQTDTTGRGTVAGVVTDTVGQPIAGATISIVGRALSAATDDSGRFRIVGVPTGTVAINVLRIGFKPVTIERIVRADSTLTVTIRLTRVQALAEVEVVETGRAPRLVRTGFFQRQRAGFGSFVTPARIDSLRPFVFGAGQFLRDARGIQLRCRGNMDCQPLSRRGDCLRIFLNGNHVRVNINDIASIDEVYAIEVYERASLTPVEFLTAPGRGQSMQRCGAIAIWTRNFAGPR